MIRESGFRRAWWLPGAHLQTLWASLARLSPRPVLRRERLELPDGDFLDLDWSADTGGPVVVVLHGLEGSSDSPYVRGVVATLAARGWRAVVMHHRGCGGEVNRLARSYSAGDTADLEHVVSTLRRREPATPLACVGYSLGGNVLLKWLGERGAAAPVEAAVAVSVPFVLRSAARRLRRGFSRLYQAHLLARLRANYRAKFRHRTDAPVPLAELARLRDFFAFDDRITAPLHGYGGVEDYYRRASCRPYLAAIRRPTLIIQAVDDPFTLPEAIPGPAELPPALTLELSRHGGHVGFVGGHPLRPAYWLDGRIADFLATRLASRTARGPG